MYDSLIIPEHISSHVPFSSKAFPFATIQILIYG